MTLAEALERDGVALYWCQGGCGRLVPVTSLLPEWCAECSDAERTSIECNGPQPSLVLIKGRRQ